MVLPSPCHAVPFFWGSDDDISIFYTGQLVKIGITCQLCTNEPETQKLLIPIP